jgi:hypothetical protein
LLVHVFVFGLVVMLTPLGVEVKSMLWMLPVSWFMNTMVVPAATVRLLGWKFSFMFPPTPLGMTMVIVGPVEVFVPELEVVDEVVEEVVVLVVGTLLVVVVEVVLEVAVEPGTKMK